MKTPLLLLGALSALTTCLLAQSQPTPDEGAPNATGKKLPPPPPPPPPRVVRVLDADHNRVISAEEIANASSALLTLDKDGDGLLSREEFCGPPPPPPQQKRKSDQEKSGQRPPPKDPLIGALDADKDKSISATEISNAPTALAALDKNADGQLTPREFAPPPPRRKPHGPKGDSPTGAAPSPTPAAPTAE